MPSVQISKPGVASAAGAVFDTTPVDLSAPGQDALDVAVATAPNGTSTVVWARSDGLNRIIQAVRITADGFAGAPINLSAPGQDAWYPDVVTAPNGTSTITWLRSNGTNDAVQAVRIDAKGKKSPTLTLSAPGQDAYRSAAAVAPNGTTTVIWTRSNGTKDIAQAVRIDAKGKKSPTLTLSAPGQSADQVAVATAANGASTLAWQRWDGSHYVIQGARINAKGQKGTTLNLSAPGQNAFSPRVAASTDGTGTVAWYRLDGVNFIAQAVRIDPRGGKGATLSLSAPGQHAQSVNVASTPNGISTVAWHRSNGINDIVQAVRIDAKGKKGSVVDLSAPGFDADYPNVTTGPNGTSTIAWVFSDTVNQIVRAVRLDAAGGHTSVVDLSLPSTSSIGFPKVATAANGTSTVAWSRTSMSSKIAQAIRIR